MKTEKISWLSKGLLLVVSGLFMGSLMFPMWQIDLDAPQYPEGLVLKLYANKIGGDVEIINGLNHYIGMATLHTENFIEFKILPYIIGFFGVLALTLVFFSKRKGILYLLFGLILFTITAGIDFYRWNYEYGHNLDPNAAIKVPGMAYQPPLIGYKQLLNFGAYSVPDIGGWMLITAGLLLFITVAKEYKWYHKYFKTKNITLLMLSFTLFSCGPKEADPIKLHSDQCEYCKMPISDGKFGAEVITQKGRIYKFDDVLCLVHYTTENEQITIDKYFVNDYATENILIDATKSFYIKGGLINSPMHGNIAAFANENKAKEFQQQLESESISWNEVLNLDK